MLRLSYLLHPDTNNRSNNGSLQPAVHILTQMVIWEFQNNNKKKYLAPTAGQSSQCRGYTTIPFSLTHIHTNDNNIQHHTTLSATCTINSIWEVTTTTFLSESKNSHAFIHFSSVTTNLTGEQTLRILNTRTRNTYFKYISLLMSLLQI